MVNPSAAKTRVSGRSISWLRVGNGTPMVPSDGKVVPGEDAGYAIYAVSLDTGLTALTAMLGGAQVLVGFKNAAGSTAIFSGAQPIPADIREQFDSCINKLMADMANK